MEATPGLVEMLDADHELQSRLLEEMSVRFRLRVLLLPVLTSQLIAHLAAERSALHPVANEVGCDHDLLTESAAEHRRMDGLLDQLGKVEPSGFEFDQHLHELAELHASHLKHTSTLANDVSELVSATRLPAISAQFLATRSLWLAPKPGYQHVWEV